MLLTWHRMNTLLLLLYRSGEHQRSETKSVCFYSLKHFEWVLTKFISLFLYFFCRRTHIVSIDQFPVKHFGHTDISSMRINHKNMERVLVRPNAFQRVQNIWPGLIIGSNLKHKAEDLIISLNTCAKNKSTSAVTCTGLQRSTICSNRKLFWGYMYIVG